MTYRIDWPRGFDRTPPPKRQPYPHNFRVSRREAVENILEELRKMGADDVNILTDAEHQSQNSNMPYSDAPYKDPGVVVYFHRNGRSYAVPCDRWDNLRDNAQAIAKYLNAKRALDRYGVETVENEFTTQIYEP